ncbi:phosphatidate cytidylyltransferase [Burkholderiaceae bacterium DAT-1]|nr:phosphatidate cytidylyltransferase [Burkholderiaceae bacterium DAT-1]
MKNFIFSTWLQSGLCIALGYVLLFIGTVNLLAILHPKSRNHRPTRDAIQSWWPVVIVVALGTLIGPSVSILVYSILGAALAGEAIRLLNLPAERERGYQILGALLAILVPASVVYSPPLALIVMLLALLIVLPSARMLIVGAEGMFIEVAPVQWVLFTSIGLTGFSTALVFMQVPGPYSGRGAAFTCFLITMISDSMQWLGGKLLGKHPLIPRVSPKKTREGLLFGITVCSLLGAAIFPGLMQRPAWEGAIVGCCICMLGTLGDLVASTWKREAGVKDSGTLLPGQGGLLDRCDSLIFVVPVFWFYIYLAY